MTPRNLGDGAGVWEAERGVTTACRASAEADNSNVTNTTNPTPSAMDFKFRMGVPLRSACANIVQTLYPCIWFTRQYAKSVK